MDDWPDDFQHFSPSMRLRATAIEKAVAAERERCATIADGFATRYLYQADQYGDPIGTRGLQAMTASNIAESIRAATPPSRE